jgi:hypothetical protein
MATICYTWSDADLKWNEAPITWREGCLIAEILQGGGGNQSIIRHRLKKLPKEDKDVLISLVTRIMDTDKEFEKKITKGKNKNIRIGVKHVEILLKEMKNIELKIFIN